MAGSIDRSIDRSIHTSKSSQSITAGQSSTHLPERLHRAKYTWPHRPFPIALPTSKSVMLHPPPPSPPPPAVPGIVVAVVAMVQLLLLTDLANGGDGGGPLASELVLAVLPA